MQLNQKDNFFKILHILLQNLAATLPTMQLDRWLAVANVASSL